MAVVFPTVRYLLKTIVFCFTCFVIVSCSSSGNSQNTSIYLEMSSYPENGEVDFSYNSSIYLFFSEAVNEATISDNIFLYSDGISKVFSFDYFPDFNIIKIKPYSLDVDKTYELCVLSGLKAVSGKAFESDKSIIFSVSDALDVTAPEIIKSSPSNNEVGVAIDSVLEIIFSENIDPSFFDKANFSFKEDDVEKDFEFTYDFRSRTFRVTPHDGFEISADYIFSSNIKYCDYAGNESVDCISISFQVQLDGDIPYIVSVIPTDGSNSLSIKEQTFLIKFSERMDSGTITTNNIYLSQNGTLVDSSIEYLSDSYSVKLSPTGDLSLNTLYSLTITSWVKGKCGLSVTEKTFSYRTQKNESEYIIFYFDGNGNKMLYVPGKKYKSGLSDSSISSVEHGFYIAESELSYKTWRTVYLWAVEHGYEFSNAGREGSEAMPGTDPVETDDYPVSTISFRDAVVWCNAATAYYNANVGTTLTFVYCSDAAGTIPIKKSTAAKSFFLEPGGIDNPYITKGSGFRLPRSSEWNLASRYKSDLNNDGDIMDADEYYPFDYTCGSTGNSSYDFRIVSWFSENSSGTAHPIKQKAASAYNLYDMGGNLYEYAFDWAYTNVYQYIKGGAYNQNMSALKNETIHYQEPWYVSKINGMRIAISDCD